MFYETAIFGHSGYTKKILAIVHTVYFLELL